MYLEYLLSVPQANDLTFAEGERPLFLHKIGEYETNFVYFIHSETDPALNPDLAQATVIGVWDFDGNLIEDTYTFNATEYQKFRPFGNDDGAATDQLGYSHAAGWGQRMQTATTLYPADNQPFEVTIERVWDDTPGWEGWGWTATIEFADPNRDPSVRAVLVDMVDNVGSGEYTTGAFVLTEVGQDEDGNPIEKWQTGNPASRVSDDPQDITVTLLLGAQAEGTWTLPAGQQKATRLFWEGNQVIPGSGWQDSGATVSSMAGTVTLVSDQSLFSVGQLVRIDGVEQTVQSLWTTTGLVLTPYTANSAGATIEVWV